MDVHCLNCQEPWDTYHLRHDAIWDAISAGHLWSDIIGDDAQVMMAKLRERWPEQKLTDEVRAAMKLVGWEFGGIILVINHCPCCKDNQPKPANEEAQAKAKAVEQLLGDDLDGAASELSGD